MVTHRAKVPSRVAIGWAGAGGCIWVAVAAGGSTIVEFGQTEYPLCIPLQFFFGPWPMDDNGCPLFGRCSRSRQVK